MRNLRLLRKSGIFSRALGVACAVSVLASGCGKSPEELQHAIKANPQKSFSEFAQKVFNRLSSNPMSDSVDVKLGLLGGEQPLEGAESMSGKYQYKNYLDGPAPKGAVRFSLRATGRTRRDYVVDYEITLMFAAKDGKWELVDATWESRSKTEWFTTGEDRAFDSFAFGMQGGIAPWVKEAVSKSQ